MDTTSTSLKVDRAPAPLTQGAKRIAWRSGLAGLILQAAVLAGFIITFALQAVLPSHMTPSLERNGPLVAMALVLFWCALGGALWGGALARISRLAERRRLAWAGAIAYGPTTVLAIFLLNEAEKYFVEGAGRTLAPVHVVFAILFTLSATAVSAVIGGALGLALRDRRLALKLALYAGVTAGAVFLVADVVQDLLGRRVGGPNAAATATMITVMFAGNILASVGASAVIGVLLGRYVDAKIPH